MPLMDEFREERAALKSAPLKEKLKYFWDYYKWHVIIISSIVLFTIAFIYEIVTKKEYVFDAVLLNASFIADEAAYKQSFAEYAGIDLNESDILFDTSIRIKVDNALMDDVSMSSNQKLMVYTAANELDVMLTDNESFQKYAYSYTFHDMRNILTEEQLAKYEPYFYYIDGVLLDKIEAANSNLDSEYTPEYPDPSKPEDMLEPIPIGLLLTDCTSLTDTFYFRGDGIALGVYANSLHVDTALKYIDYILEAQ